jgi:acylphosphatase
MIAGSPASVEAMISWARVGPAAAQVERVEVSAAEGTFAGFELRPTL